MTMFTYKQEQIEWTQFWREGSPDENTRRVLIIGDSITVGYRHLVEQKLEGKYHVSAVSTSKALDNPWLMDEIKLLIKQDEVSYDIVHFNNGAHGGHLKSEEYGVLYEKFVCELMQLFPKAKFIMALTTPMMCAEDLTKFHPTYNKNSIERNEQALDIAKKYNITVEDLYSAALSEPGLHCEDGIHYNDHGWDVLADTVVKTILSV